MNALDRRTRVVFAAFCLLAIDLMAQRAELDLVISNVAVIAMASDEPEVLLERWVGVADGRIVSITDEAPVAAARTIDGAGRFLMPGLIDTHTHLLSDDRIADEHAPSELDVILSQGVTTIRIPIGKPSHLARRELIRRGELRGPRLFVGSPQFAARAFGHIFNGRVALTTDDARAAVREFAEAGYDFLKITFWNEAPIYDAIVDEAQRVGIAVTGHVGPRVGLDRALRAGQQIEHLDQFLEALIPDGADVLGSVSGVEVWRRDHWPSLDILDDRQIDALAQRAVEADVWSSPTLAFLNASFGTGRAMDVINASPDARFVSPSVRADLLRGHRAFWKDPPSAVRRARFVELRQRITKALHDAGGRVMAGSDAPEWLMLYGFTLHRELDELVAAGFTPYEALRAATHTPGEWLARFARSRQADDTAPDIGVIRLGAAADLVLLTADPLADIANTRAIEGVCAGGVWYDRAALDALADDAADVLAKARLQR